MDFVWTIFFLSKNEPFINAYTPMLIVILYPLFDFI